MTSAFVSVTTSWDQSFPATCAPGTCFCNQCEHWRRKQYHKSVSRPEIPKDFRLTQSFSLALKNPRGFSTLRKEGSDSLRIFMVGMGDATADNFLEICMNSCQFAHTFPQMEQFDSNLRRKY
jgi:hypothetical protein